MVPGCYWPFYKASVGRRSSYLCFFSVPLLAFDMKRPAGSSGKSMKATKAMAAKAMKRPAGSSGKSMKAMKAMAAKAMKATKVVPKAKATKATKAVKAMKVMKAMKSMKAKTGKAKPATTVDMGVQTDDRNQNDVIPGNDERTDVVGGVPDWVVTPFRLPDGRVEVCQLEGRRWIMTEEVALECSIGGLLEPCLILAATRSTRTRR